MKKTLCFNLFVLLLLLNGNRLLAEDIYKVDFSTYLGKGYWGNESNMVNVEDWLLDISNCKLSDAKDYIKLSATGKGQLEAKGCDSEAIWKSKPIDISSFPNVNISIVLAENGSSSNKNTYHVLDGATETLLETNGENVDNWSKSEGHQAKINGNTLNESEELLVQSSHSSSLSVLHPQGTENRISSLWVEREQAFEVLRFRVVDTGNDGLPTILKKVQFTAGELNNINWKYAIKEFLLRKEGQTLATKTEVKNNKLTIHFLSEEDGKVESEKHEDFSIYCYLKKGKTTDGAKLQIQVDPMHPGWNVSNQGSGLLKPFTGNLTGDSFTLQVDAEKMIFSDVPKTIDFQEEFPIQIQLVDRFGNLDRDLETEIELSVASGNGVLSPQPLKRFSGTGTFNWENLTYSKSENFSLQADNQLFSTILSNQISGVDKTSEIRAGSPVSTRTLNPLQTKKREAIPVLNFRIADAATHDNLPTTLTSMKFVNAKPQDAFSWQKHIAGAVLMSNEEILAYTTDITDEYIRFSSSKGVVFVETGSEKELNLGIFFRKSQLPDHANMQVKIPKEKHEWKCLLNGSALRKTMPKEIISELYPINTVASKLAFLETPFAISKSDKYFSIRLGACDQHGNIDADLTTAVNINLQEGEGDFFVKDKQVLLENGILELDSVLYNGNDNFTITSQSILESTSADILFGIDELSVNENFESKTLQNWINTSDWKVSSYRPINEDYSLKHNLSFETGRSYTSTLLKDFSPNSGAVCWSFTIKNGNWAPTSGNHFAFHVLMDHSDPQHARKIYSVGVNQEGADDMLSLWSTNKNKAPTLLLKSEFEWNKNEEVSIRVIRKANGKWLLQYNRLGKKTDWLLIGTAFEPIKETFPEWYSGLEFSFESASRAGQLWFDDLKIESINTPPFLKNHKIIGQDSIVLEYSENLNATQSHRKENFIWRTNGNRIEFDVLNSNSENSIILKAKDKLTTGEYQLTISNISDTKGATNKLEAINFNYFAPATKHDLVINEIMLDESPVVALPEFEYLELYNTSAYPVHLTNWIVTAGEKEFKLKTGTLPAKEYLLLCRQSAAEQFKKFGTTIGIKNFPALNNLGVQVKLVSPEGVVIDQITFRNSWHDSEEKKNGGWSLERIDPQNHAWQEKNWKSSQNKAGGTPGSINSVYSRNRDETAPQLIAFSYRKGKLLKLSFNEPIDSQESFLPQNYRVNQGIGEPESVTQTDKTGKEFVLYFSEKFIPNQKYQLTLSEKLKDLAGNSTAKREHEFWVSDEVKAGDLVVNEVLFNPLTGGSDYVEIFNNSQKIVDLTDIKLGTRTENLNLSDTVPITTDFLHPQKYILVSSDTTNVAQNYFNHNSEVFYQIKSMPPYPDDKGRVVLSYYGNIIDDFEYNKKMHFKLLASDQGVALERVNPGQPTNNDSNWQSAAQNAGFGTPGLKNSVFSEYQDDSSEVSLSSNIFSPDNDGVDDRLLIKFNLKKSGYLVSVLIYNSHGSEVRKLASNVNLANQDHLFWDGLTSKQQRAPIGMYLVYIELSDTEGNVQIMKKTCVLGGKFN